MKISDLPKQIRELALKRREECKQGWSSKDTLDSFYWEDTIEGVDFWDKIDRGHFEVFYELYPDPENKLRDIRRMHLLTSDDLKNALKEVQDKLSSSQPRLNLGNLNTDKNDKDSESINATNEKTQTYVLYKDGDCQSIIADDIQLKENCYVFYLLDCIVGCFPNDYVMIKE